jgi:transcriptional regulator with XRE-family HTH domain
MDRQHALRRRRARQSEEYRTEAARLEPYESLARMIIARRIRYGLTQGQLAARMETSVSAISRLESGQHMPSLTTLDRVARAFGERGVVGFEDEQRVREVTALSR